LIQLVDLLYRGTLHCSELNLKVKKELWRYAAMILLDILSYVIAEDIFLWHLAVFSKMMMIIFTNSLEHFIFYMSIQNSSHRPIILWQKSKMRSLLWSKQMNILMVLSAWVQFAKSSWKKYLFFFGSFRQRFLFFISLVNYIIRFFLIFVPWLEMFHRTKIVTISFRGVVHGMKNCSVDTEKSFYSFTEKKVIIKSTHLMKSIEKVCMKKYFKKTSVKIFYAYQKVFWYFIREFLEFM